MSDPIAHHVKDMAAMEAMLVSDSPTARMNARAIANGWPGLFEDWIRAELALARGPKAAEVVINSLMLQMQMQASVLAFITGEGGDEQTAANIAQLIKVSLPDMIAVQRAAQQAGKVRAKS